MMATEAKKIHFKNTGKEQDRFLAEVRKRVERYFAVSKLQKTAGWSLHLKNAVLACTLVFIYLTLLNGWFAELPRILVFMAFGINQAFLTVNLGHDSAHGSYTNSTMLNRIFAYLSYDLIGMSSYVWKQTHNQEHHTFTNIAGADPDIHKPGILRLSPHDPHHPLNRFQHLYVWFLYALVGMNWVLYSDYAHMWKQRKQISTGEWVAFWVFKAINIFLTFFALLFFSPMAWWQVVAGYIVFQCVGGFSVAVIFQLAHLVENVDFPLPDEEGVIDASWGEHEMKTTSNFATKNLFVTHVVGGLNFQVEHHLFPKISHCHYPALSQIVRQTARDFSLPYHEQPTFLKAVASHARVLKRLGAGN